MSISLLRRLSLALGFSLAASNALAENWPQPDWQSQPRIESPALAELEQYAFPNAMTSSVRACAPMRCW